MGSTLDHVKALLARDYALAPEHLAPEVSLDSLGIDSLGAVELMWNLEAALGIKLPAEPVALDTLGDVVAFLDRVLARQGTRRASAAPVA